MGMVSEFELGDQGLKQSPLPEIASDAIFRIANHAIDMEIDELLSFCLSEYGEADLVKAKEEFFDRTGKVFPHEDSFHPRMSYFTDFYLFHRPLPEVDHQSAFERFLNTAPKKPKTLTGVRHSLYRVWKCNPTKLVLKDLFDLSKWTVEKRIDECFLGIHKNDLIQGHLYLSGALSYLSRGVIFHDPSLTRALKKWLKPIRKQGDPLSFDHLAPLASMQLKAARHQKIQPIEIYRNLPNL